MTDNRGITWKKVLRIVLFLLLALIILIILFLAGYFYKNINDYEWDMANLAKAGFVEKQTEIDGYITNYAEGPDNGTPLLLIHGQGSQWEDYAKVAPTLSEHYHIYAIDVYGHGESARLPAEEYTNVRVGNLIAEFMAQIIAEPALVSGHSSGGLLTTWIAANHPELVLGIILEDPPYYSSIMPRASQTAGGELMQLAHDFLAQNEETNFPKYYIEHGSYFSFFGDSEANIVEYSLNYMDQHPDEPLELFFLPANVNIFLRGLANYDPAFGAAWYDSSWYDGFDTEANLAAIDRPAILMHTNYWFNHFGSYYSDDGILMAAMNDDDVHSVVSLLDDVTLFQFDSGHLVHLEKSTEYTEILIEFGSGIE